MIPWSETAEKNLRRAIWTYWIVLWVHLCSFLMAGAFLWMYPKKLPGVLLFIWSAVWVCFAMENIVLLRIRLGREMSMGTAPGLPFDHGAGMLSNKPRSTGRLTKWQQVPSDLNDGLGTRWLCACGRSFSFPDMESVTLSGSVIGEIVREIREDDAVDPDILAIGENRWVYHCPCGEGHFYMLREGRPQ